MVHAAARAIDVAAVDESAGLRAYLTAADVDARVFPDVAVLTRAEDRAEHVAARDVHVGGVRVTHLAVLQVNGNAAFYMVIGHHTAAGTEHVAVVVAGGQVGQALRVVAGKGRAVGVDVTDNTAADVNLCVAAVLLVLNHVDDVQVGLCQAVDTH